ncbi:hypothetical protein F4802DRAFT_275708 [Xylaria palmicola]|nr:hypothetical protein F4802DRAFT_275708 [Xylaria palmicola]
MSLSTYQSPYKPTPTSTRFDAFMRWLRLRKYRIEVTYGVYVYTPMEKLLFWALFWFFFLAVSTALALYTHRTVAFLARAVVAHVVGSAASQILAAKHAATGLLTTASARTSVVKTAMDLMAQNSQVA